MQKQNKALQRLQPLGSLCCWQPAASAADPAHYAAKPVAASVSAGASNTTCLGHLLIWIYCLPLFGPRVNGLCWSFTGGSSSELRSSNVLI